MNHRPFSLKHDGVKELRGRAFPSKKVGVAGVLGIYLGLPPERRHPSAGAATALWRPRALGLDPITLMRSNI